MHVSIKAKEGNSYKNKVKKYMLHEVSTNI